MVDATWAGPGSDWNTNANWSQQMMPDGTAIFAGASPTTVTFSTSTSIETVQFDDGPYTFDLNGQFLSITGIGIVDNTGLAPTFNGPGFLEFDNAATAGDAIINNTPGATTFTGTSTAGNATIANSGGGLLSFTDTSDAGSALITTNNGSATQFSTNSNGGFAQFITNAGGTVDFSGTSGPDGLNHITAGSIAGAGTYHLGANELTVGGNSAATTTVSGVIDGIGGSLVKAGAVTLILSGSNTYTGATTITNGVLEVDGSISSAVTVQDGGTLDGIGTTGVVTVEAGGTLAPGAGAGILHTGDAAFTATARFTIELGGTGAGEFDKLQVSGGVNLGGATLSGSLINGFTPTNGDPFVIIDNDGMVDAVNGTFAGIAEGGFIGIGGRAFQITYQGGDGNDVVLTAVPNPPLTLTGLGPSVTFPENTVNAIAQILDSDVTFTDLAGSFDGGTLTVSGLLLEDFVSIHNQGIDVGQIGFDSDTLVVSFGGTSIGTVSGGDAGNKLTVTFNANATSAAVDAVIENLAYFNSSGTPTASRVLNVTVTDASFASTGAVPITVNVTAQNEVPVMTVDSDAEYTENAAPIVLAPNLTLSDADAPAQLQQLVSATVAITSGFVPGDILNWPIVLVPASAGASYNPLTGVLTITADDSLVDYQNVLNQVTFASSSDNPTNFGASPTRILTWTVTDIGSPHATSVPVTSQIVVTAINDAPVITSDGGGASATLPVAENTTPATTVKATDPDGTTLSFTISGGADAAKFAINASTGALSFIAAPNFEAPTDSDGNNSYLVTVRASDGSLFDDQAITVNVTNANEAPIITSNGGGDTATAAIAENTTPVTTVTATDPDGTTPSFTISGGADASKFAINASTGALSFVTAPNFEAPTDSDGNNSYIVQVRASDGTLFDDQTITVNITNVNEFAPVITSNGGGDTANVSIGENTVAVTTVTATDVDAGTTLAFAISGGADAAKFQINAASGALSFIGAPNFENPTDSDHNNSYIVQVRASDGSLSDGQVITVNVTDVKETVTIARPVDFNADSFDDLLWRTADGGVSVWTYKGGLVNPLPTLTGSAPLSTTIEGTGDFNGDGRGDILFRSADGHIAEWLMNGTQITAARDIGTVDASWHVSGTGDFNGDHTDDILFRNDAGQVATWSMQGGNLATIKVAGSAGPSSHIQGTGDFNGDGQTDILFRNDDGHVATWLMNNGQASAVVDIGSAPATAHIAGTGDFNGDGQTDILFRGNDGHVIEWLMTSGHVMSIQDIGSADASWNILGTGDLNGDGREDILLSNGDGHVTAAWLLNNAGQLASAQDIGHTPTGTQMAGSNFDLV